MRRRGSSTFPLSAFQRFRARHLRIPHPCFIRGHPWPIFIPGCSSTFQDFSVSDFQNFLFLTNGTQIDLKYGIASKTDWYYPLSMTTISLKLPEPVAERLAAEARLRRKPKSALVREFIERGLSGGAADGKPSFYALSKDKSGRFRGPRDLSTNPKYMEGYGR